MPPLIPHWYLYYCLLLTQLFFLAFSGVCSWHVGRENDFEISLGNSVVPIVSDNSEDRNRGYEETLEVLSLKVDLVSCEDLEGVGSFNTTCLLNSNVHLNSSIYAFGTGNLEILPHISIVCPLEGCSISFNVSGNVKVGRNAAIIAGSIVISAHSLNIGHNASVNTTSLAGRPPPQTSGTPFGYDGDGGGHGGRGASCSRNEQRDAWGGDVYSWSNVSRPWSYGSKGSGRSAQNPLGGNGGGRVKLIAEDELYLNGSVTAEGGDGGANGGGGSGGSIIINAFKLSWYYQCSRWKRMGRRRWRKNITSLLQHTRCQSYCAWWFEYWVSRECWSSRNLF